MIKKIYKPYVNHVIQKKKKKYYEKDQSKNVRRKDAQREKMIRDLRRKKKEGY